MARSIEASHRIAEIALGALKQIGLVASPRNIEVWCAHVEGVNPALSRDIQKAMDGDGYITQSQADEIYKTRIQRMDLSRDVVDLVTRFQKEVTDLYDMIESSGESTHGHNETLSDLAAELRQSTEEYPAVGALLEGVITVTKSMRSENEILELRLADSATEISALQRNVEHIQAEAMKDALTGIANRATFDNSLQKQLNEAAASGEPLALVLADIDHFNQELQRHLGPSDRRSGVAPRRRSHGRQCQRSGLAGALWRRGIRDRSTRHHP